MGASEFRCSELSDSHEIDDMRNTSEKTEDKACRCPLQPMRVVVNASAAAAEAETEQLPEGEGLWWCPLKGRTREEVQVMGLGGDAGDSDVDRRRWLLTWMH
jgi:hypothetical protein